MLNLIEEKQTINEWKNLLLIYKFALDEMMTKIKIIREDFEFIHQHNPIEHVNSRIKTPSSINQKLKRKNIPVSVENAKKYINDIAGIRITCSFVSDIYNIVDIICGQDDIEVIKIKDYIKNPKENGYRSVHLQVSIPVFLTKRTEKVKVEIQIRTIAMDFWASLEHKIYYKFDKLVPEHLLDELKEAAEVANRLDIKMEKISDEMNEVKNNRQGNDSFD